MEQTQNRSVRLRLKQLLLSNPLVQVCEILLVFAVAVVFIWLAGPLAKNNPVWKQGIAWFANILMLLLIRGGMLLRGEKWSSFGLTFGRVSLKQGLTIFLYALLVLVLAVAGFLVGSVIMANITGIPESADMSSYDYLKNNIGMLILTLLGVYVVSSFGEEVIYRAFLITRITQIGAATRAARIFAVIISAVIFGFAHFAWGPVGIVQTGFMGLALAIAFLMLKRKLWILIIAHAIMDTTLMIQMYLSQA